MKLSRIIELIVIAIVYISLSVALGMWGFLIALWLTITIINVNKPKPRRIVIPTPDKTFDELFEEAQQLKIDIALASLNDLGPISVPSEYYVAYRVYLRSSEWKLLRKQALVRDGHRCQMCGYIGDTLQVHHLHYKGIETMTFHLDQLQTLCTICHNEVHSHQ